LPVWGSWVGCAARPHPPHQAKLLTQHPLLSCSAIRLRLHPKFKTILRCEGLLTPHMAVTAGLWAVGTMVDLRRGQETLAEQRNTVMLNLIQHPFARALDPESSSGRRGTQHFWTLSRFDKPARLGYDIPRCGIFPKANPRTRTSDGHRLLRTMLLLA